MPSEKTENIVAYGRARPQQDKRDVLKGMA